MKNLFQPEEIEEIKIRLDHLKPNLERQWGKMNPSQMLAHCSMALEMALGDRVSPRMILGRMIGLIVKPFALGNDEPMRRNSPTVTGLAISDEHDFEVERERLRKLIDRFIAVGPNGSFTQPHSFFGRMTSQEWAVLMYKHLDHHFRQFGV